MYADNRMHETVKTLLPILEQMFVRISSYIRAYKAYRYSINIIALRYGYIE